MHAAELPPNITSNIAGGEWFPFGVVDFEKRTPELMNEFRQAAEFAYGRYQIVLGPRYGCDGLRKFDVGHTAFDENGLVATIRPSLPEIRDHRNRSILFRAISSCRSTTRC